MSNRLEGKVAIVTGAGSVHGAPDRQPIGNGRAAAIVYAREGAAVVAVDIDLESAQETKALIEKRGAFVRCAGPMSPWPRIAAPWRSNP